MQPFAIFSLLTGAFCKRGLAILVEVSPQGSVVLAAWQVASARGVVILVGYHCKGS